MNTFKKAATAAAMVCAVAAWTAHASADTATGRYWFDDRPEMHPFAPGHIEVPTDALPTGLHTLNAVVERDGVLSSPHSAWFIKQAPVRAGVLKSIVSVDGRHFVTAPLTGNGVCHLDLDMTAVAAGIHSLSAVMTCDDMVESICSGWFVKTMALNNEALTTNVYIDGELYRSFASASGSAGVIHLDVDMNRLATGVHTISAQVIGSAGAVTPIEEKHFLRVPSDAQLAALKGFYSIDGRQVCETEVTKSGMHYSMNPDLSSLTAGIHFITAYLAGADGITTSPVTSWFVKIPVGGEGVRTYRYWLNDDTTTVRTVTLDKAANPLSIVSLVDVPEQPIVSSRYTFAVDNGKPTVYARNRFATMFFDGDGRAVYGSADYTDVRISSPIETILPLTDNACTEVKGIADNEIRWYSFEGTAGDSIGVRLDRGAMCEVFTPTAGKIIAMEGADAMTYHTATLRENGTHYLAVHDPAKNAYGNVNADFVHIGRYALLHQTPSRTATDGFMVMEVEGNGFNSIATAALVSAEGATREPEQILVEDNYWAKLVFDLDNSPMAKGEYRLQATFADGETGERQTAVGSERLTVEEGEPVDITVDIVTPRIARTPYEVEVVVTNRSNTGVWGVPLTIAITDNGTEGTAETLNFAIIDHGSETEAVCRVDNLLGTGKPGTTLPMIIPYLSPNESHTYTMGLTTDAHAIVEMRAWAGQPWSQEAKEMLSPGYDYTQFATASDGDHLSLLDIARCLTEIDNESDEVDLGDPGKVAEVATQVARQASAGYAYGIAAAPGYILNSGTYVVGSIKVVYDLNRSSNSRSSHSRGRHRIVHVTYQGVGAGAFNSGFPGVSGPLGAKAQAMAQSQATNGTPNAPAHSVDCYQSGDPNDLYGYVAPSGSRYMNESVKRIVYDIEFENDPEIANAPATRIAVTNTPDGKHLNLATFRPLTMTLGSQTVDLPAEHHFVKTLDMRPGINAVAELTFDFDEATGAASWSIRSLDPMTMEPVKYMDNGVLPVNYDGQCGTGHLTYSIELADGVGDGTEISNQATIVFDDNDPIDTPVFTNITDYTLPTSRIVSVATDDNKTFAFEVEGEDSGSGIHYYDLYCKQGASGEWRLVKTQIETNEFAYVSDNALDGATFAVIAVDYAGNVQEKTLLTALLGDADGNGSIDANDVVVIQNYYTNPKAYINMTNADVTLDGKIDSQDATTTANIYLSKTKKITIRTRLKK